MRSRALPRPQASERRRVAFYAQAEEQQNTYILIAGIVLLMLGVYRISRNVPSKFEHQKEETFVQTEKDED